MRYGHVEKAVFIARPNRFIAHVLLGEQRVTCHVKNTGRCRELLVPGAAVYIERAENPNRKTAHDLIAVQKGGLLINMDSQAPNRVFASWAVKLMPGLTLIKPEAVFGDSRFDFYLEAGPRRAFVEVKGVTLEENGQCLFPDAPTQRGVKHLHGLSDAVKQGYEAYVVFVIQMAGALSFSPNDQMHPAFGEALRKAANAGVNVIAVDCLVTPNSMEINAQVPIVL